MGYNDECVEYWRMVGVVSHYAMRPHYDSKELDKIAPEKLVRLPGQKEEKREIVLAKVWRDGEEEPK